MKTFIRAFLASIIVIVAFISIGAVTTVIKGVYVVNTPTKGDWIYVRDTVIIDSNAMKAYYLTSAAWSIHDFRIIFIGGDSCWIKFNGQRGRTSSTRLPIRMLLNDTLRFMNCKLCSLYAQTHTEAAEETLLFEGFKHRD